MINRTGFTRVVACLTFLSLNLGNGGAGNAASEPPFRARYAVKAVQIENFAGTLMIKVGKTKTTLLKLTGPEKSRKSLKIAMQNNILHVRDRRPVRQIRNSVHVERNVVIVGPGGYSNVVIGGEQQVRQNEDAPLRLELTIPAGLPLGIDGVSGNLTIGSTLGPVMLSLVEGSARIGQVHAATFKIVGAGDITARRVNGPLAIAIDGSGAVSVGDGAMPSLTIDSNGTAEVEIGGSAGDAEIDANGVADIRIAHVKNAPRVSINGAGTVEIGNWDLSDGAR